MKARRPGRATRARGFTLLELIVVLGIMALLASVAAAPLLRRLAPSEADRVAAELVETLRTARLRAIRSGATQVVRVAPDGSPLGGSSAEGGWTLGMHPDGTSTGGEVPVVRDGQRRLVIVDWLTGSIEIREAR